MKRLIPVIAVLAALFLVGCVGNVSQPSFKKFSSCSEMKGFIEANSQKDYGYYGYRLFDMVMPTGATTGASESGGQKASDYSTTNIQVAGVDEADITKNDGEYIYTKSGNKIVIVDAYPADAAAVLSELVFNSSIDHVSEMFINGDKLVVFGTHYEPVVYDKPTNEIGYYRPYYYDQQKTFINIYNVADRSNPVLSKQIFVDGNYFSSRMIGDYAYIILNSYVQPELLMPNVTVDGEEKPLCGCADVNYFGDVIDSSYSLTTVMAINVLTDETSQEVFLTGNTGTLFVSLNNIYLTATKYVQVAADGLVPTSEQQTLVKKIGIDKEKVEFKAEGSVPGWVLNQFSMDEHNNYFRIATTVGHVSRSGSESSSGVYVLDADMKTVGTLEDLAPGEQIYSARFMGGRAYLVTFKKIDPLFVIDLSEPTNPTVLGKLKIPGYSDYLHPYDETHLIGIGKGAIAAEEGDFAWYQGVKMSLFDVSDVANPKEISMVEIGDRGTDSYVLNDHKAFLFNKEKNLLVLPILLAEKDGTETDDWEYGEFTFQGAYVYNVDLSQGFVYRGRITHVDDDSLLKSGYYYSSPASVKRSLYMDNTLYTISENTIKANSLFDLSEIKTVSLPYDETGYNGYYYGV